MRVILDVLRNLSGHPAKDLAERLGITEQEYKQIESGEIQMSLQQMTALAELIKNSTDSPVPAPPVAIYYGNHYNYNFGPKSRGINSPGAYTENDFTNKPQNHENTNPKQTGSGSSRMIYTTDLTHKLNQLRATSEEFTKATVTKSEEQFLAESRFIIDQVEDIYNQTMAEAYDVH